MIRMLCPNCGEQEFADYLAGMRIKCRKCANWLQLPLRAAAQDAPIALPAEDIPVVKEQTTIPSSAVSSASPIDAQVSSPTLPKPAVPVSYAADPRPPFSEAITAAPALPVPLSPPETPPVDFSRIDPQATRAPILPPVDSPSTSNGQSGRPDEQKQTGFDLPIGTVGVSLVFIGTIARVIGGASGGSDLFDSRSTTTTLLMASAGAIVLVPIGGICSLIGLLGGKVRAGRTGAIFGLILFSFNAIQFLLAASQPMQSAPIAQGFLAVLVAWALVYLLCSIPFSRIDQWLGATRDQADPDHPAGDLDRSPTRGGKSQKKSQRMAHIVRWVAGVFLILAAILLLLSQVVIASRAGHLPEPFAAFHGVSLIVLSAAAGIGLLARQQWPFFVVYLLAILSLFSRYSFVPFVFPIALLIVPFEVARWVVVISNLLFSTGVGWVHLTLKSSRRGG